MKIRNGFVSNSSSTSFFFIFKENSMEHFYALMREHKTHFELSCDVYWDDTNSIDYIGVEDVVKSIEDVKNIKIVPIEELSNYYERLKTSYEDLYKEEDKDFDGHDSTWADIYWDTIMDYNYKLDRIESAKQRGFKYFLKVGFGDNDGEVAGNLVGTIMDYEGRHIFVNNNRFIVITEQNR